MATSETADNASSVKLNRNGGAKRGYSLPSLRQLVQREEWMEQAACKGKPAGMFIPDPTAKHTALAVLCAEGLALCAGCPVKAECLAYAIKNGERRGVWGGQVFGENRHLRSVDHPPKIITHGTESAYRWACRCEECRDAHRRYNEGLRALHSANP